MYNTYLYKNRLVRRFNPLKPISYGFEFLLGFITNTKKPLTLGRLFCIGDAKLAVYELLGTP